MTEVNTLLQRGVCGNFRFKFYQITDAKDTNSVFNSDMQNVMFIGSTQTTDKSDAFRARRLVWSGTCDNDQTNHCEDNTYTFVAALSGAWLANIETGDALIGQGAFVEWDKDDLDDLALSKAGAVFDVCPTGDEDFTIHDPRKIMLTPATADDDGFVILIGK